MSKKKAIKITTATAIAASAFVAVAPTQSEAATSSVDKAITKATNQMAKAYDTYHKTAKNENKLPKTATIRKEVKLAKDYYAAAAKEIAKNGGSKTKKAAFTKKLDTKKKYLNRAEAYLAAINTNLNPTKTAFNTAVETGKAKNVGPAKTALVKDVEAFEATVAKIYGPDVRDLLLEKYEAPATKLANSVNDELKVYEAYKAIEKGNFADLEATEKLIEGVKAEVALLKEKDTKLAKTLLDVVAKNDAKFEAAKTPVVKEIKVTSDKTVEVTVETARTDLTAKHFTVLVDGTAVTPSEVKSDAKGEVYTLTVAGLEGKDGKVSVNGKEAAFEFAAPAVKEVSAINGKELKVTFNKAVLKDSVATTDFAVTATGTSTANVVTDVQVSADGKSATLLLTSAVPTAGVDVKIVEGAILTNSFDQFPKSETAAVKATADTTAPKLLSVVATDSTTVEFTFNEPVDWTTNSGGISVNAGAQVSGVNSTEAGNYTYTFTVPALTTGANTVQLLNYADFAGNKEALSTTSVNYAANVSTPEVASIKAEDSTSFILNLNKAVDTIANTNFTVKKGNYTFTSTDLSVGYVDSVGVTSITPTKYVKVTVPTQATSVNPLYGTNENSVSLSVALSGYKNSTVIGKEYTGSVALSKDLTAPTAVSSKLITFDKSADTITVPFDKTLTLADVNKLTVVSGTVKVAATPTVNGKNLVITITDLAGLTDGKYSLVLDKGLVKDGSDNVNEATTLSTDVTSTTATKQLTGSIFGTTAVNDNGKNVITVAYSVKVDDAAASTASYSLNGSALPNGSVAYFTTSAKDTVKIELPASYDVSLNNVNAKISLNANAVKEYATGNVISSSATEVKAVDQVVTLKDNVAPTVSKAEYVKDANGLATGLKLTFSEAVDTSSSADFTDDFVVKSGSTVIPYTVASTTSTDTATDKVVILDFTSVSTAASSVTVATNTDTTLIDLVDISGYNKISKFSVTAQ